MHLDQRRSMPSAQNWKSQGPFHWPTPQLPSRLLHQTGTEVHGYPLSSLGIGRSRYEQGQANRQDVVFIPVSLYSIHCNFASVDARVVLLQQNTSREFTSAFFFHRWRFSAGLTSLHSTLQLLYFSGKKSAQNTVCDPKYCGIQWASRPSFIF